MFRVEIEYEVGGRKYKDPRKAMSDVAASLMEEVGTQAAGQLGDVRCPDHGQAPKVTILTASDDQIEIEIRGCCEKGVDAAKEALE